MKLKLWLLLGIIYLTFVALGLPDALIGSGWNLIREDFAYPLGALGFYTFSMYVMGILATSNTPRILRHFDTNKTILMALVAMAFSLFMMSLAPSFPLLILAALPLGFGAGVIDMSVNHFLAAHYKPYHMNFLHAFYGLGVTVGPGVMALTLQEENWRAAFLIIGIILSVIALLLLLSFPIWVKEIANGRLETHQTLSFKAIRETPGVLKSTALFILLVHVESMGGLWIASYIFIIRGVTYAEAAIFTTVFFTAFTISRFLGSLLSLKLSSKRLIMLGQTFILIAAVMLFFEVEGTFYYMVAVGFYGLGAAPMFPNMMVLSGKYFRGPHLSKIMSIQMTLGYVGFGVLTPLAGFVFQRFTVGLMPYLVAAYSVALLLITYTYVRHMEHRLEQKT